MANYRENVTEILRCLGGNDNIINISNCMTRLRVTVADEALVNEARLSALEDVLGLVHDRTCSYEIVVGPGKCRKYANLCTEMGLTRRSADRMAHDSDDGAPSADWRKNKETLKSNQKRTPIKNALKTLGDIFIPLIPGVIAAGLCTGIASLITQLVPAYADIKVWNIIYNILSLLSTSFMTFITAWVGYRAAERFGATPILGGMLGMITSLDGINTIAQQIGLYNNDAPLASILRNGKGGVLAVVFGVLLMSFVEKKIRAKMPEALDIILTPLLTLLICVVPYILVIMPLLGFVSTGIVWVFSQLCLSQSIIVRLLIGFVSAALFLPLVATGMHHGLVALYTVQLESLGYITLYPALAMAGAGQVGAAIAIRIKAKRVGNRRMCSVIDGALPAGFLGVGEPLIYGVTLPLGKPFITAGIGAGFGGALVMAMEVASTTWGPSGVIGVFVMTAGPSGAVRGVIFYLIGLIVSYICSFLITFFTFNENQLASSDIPVAASEGVDVPNRAVAHEGAATHNIPASSDRVASYNCASSSDLAASSDPQYRHVLHGEVISFDLVSNPFTYILTDAAGIHARPAGGLVKLVQDFNSDITIEANGKKASAASLSELMNLGATHGTELLVYAHGTDEQAALAAVRQFLNEKL